MARTPTSKKLENARLLKDYASWIYCTGCNCTVAYLCYVTYDEFDFEYTCTCGCCGKVHISFAPVAPSDSAAPLKLIKNRLCCPQDDAPLVTIVEKNLTTFSFRIVCKVCNTIFSCRN